MKKFGLAKNFTVAAAVLATAGAVHAGDIMMTGHDVLLHGGQSGGGSAFDTVALDYLRGATPKASYDIAVVGSGVGSWNFSTGGQVRPDYASTTFFDTDDLTSGASLWSDVLSADVMILLSHTSCGGCDLSSAGSDEVNANSADIITAFNAGMDLWVMSGASHATYYDFLPAGVAVTGPAISGSSGFTATAEGLAIGFDNAMLNGRATHNRFTGFDPDFDVFEIRGSDEFITIGLLDGEIGTTSISTGGTTGRAVPEPITATLGVVGLGALGLATKRRKA